MSQHQLQLKSYFFTHQEVVANPDHVYDPEQVSRFDYKLQTRVSKVGEEEYGVQLGISLDEENSDNPAYFFTISVFAIVQTQETLSDGEIEMKVKSSCMPALIGVVRERLAEMTSRGPWETVIFDSIQSQVLE